MIFQSRLESKYEYNGLLHPPTYENKVLLSTTSGAILMFNIKTSKRIYTFKAAGESKINVMIKTPHLNVIGGKLLRNIDVILRNNDVNPASDPSNAWSDA